MSERKQFKLEGRKLIYPNVYHWSGKVYILVKDGEHYPISKDKLDVLVAECRGHHEEIAKYFKPRKRREKKETPKGPATPLEVAMGEAEAPVRVRTGKTSTGTWIDPEFINPGKGEKFDELGFKVC